MRVGEDGALAPEWIRGRFTAVTGYTVEEFVAAGGWLSLIHPDDFHIGAAGMQRLLNGTGGTIEFRIIRRDGQIRWVRSVTWPEFDATSGRVVRIVGASSDVTERLEALYGLHDLAVETAGVLDPGELAQVVVDRARMLVGATAALVYLHDGTSDTLRAYAASDSRAMRPDQQATGPCYRASQRAFLEGDLVIVGITESEQSVTAWAGPAGAVAAVPLRSSGTIVGVLAVVLGWPGGVLPRHVHTLRLLATQVGPGFQAVRLQARATRMQRVVDAALADLSDEDLLVELLNRAREVLRADTAVLLLLDNSGRFLRARTALGLDPEIYDDRVRVGEGFAGRVALTKRPLAVEEVHPENLEGLVLRQRGLSSLLGAPLLVESRLKGVLHVGTLDRRAFSVDDADVLQLVADRIALLVDRARAFEARAEARKQATAQRLLLKSVLDHIPSGVAVLDSAGQALMTNAACRRILDRDRERSRALPNGGLDRLVRDSNGQPVALFARAVAGESVTDAEICLRQSGTGEPLRLQVAAMPFRTSASAVAGIVVVFTDVTRERQLLRDLEATAVNHARLLGALADQELRFQSMVGSLQPLDADATEDLVRQRLLLATLTPREHEILGLMTAGRSPRDIQASLHLGAGTVKNHLAHIVAKLGVEDRVQAVLMALHLENRSV